MRFDWTDLRIFLHVCEAGSMTAAAERCHLTLAAVSARMRSLEEANGITLLQRRARGVSPTLAGEVLAAHARVVFEQIQQLERDLLHAHTELPRRMVLLANSSAIANTLLPDALAAAWDGPAQRPPLLVRESASEATVQALRAGVADVGIVSDAVDTRGLAVRELGPDPLVLVAAQAHALAQRPSVRLQDLLPHGWIVGSEQSALFTHLQMRALAARGRIQASMSYPTTDGMLRLVARGLGVTVLPQMIMARHSDNAALATVPLDEPWARRRLLVCYLNEAPAQRRDLADAIVGTWVSA